MTEPNRADIRTNSKPLPPLAVASTDHPLINGKKVYSVQAKSVLNLNSGFRHKKLCTSGLTFSAGSACAYGCCYCYVAPLMAKNPHRRGIKEAHHEVIIRREGAVAALREQLRLLRRSNPARADDPEEVLYMSPLEPVMKLKPAF